MNDNAQSWVRRFDKWRSDSWENALTGLGIIGKDKRMSASAKYYRLTKREIETTYASDDMLSKIVDVPAEDMVREGFEILVKDEDKKIDDLVQSYLDDRNGHNALATGLNWARMYGGSGVLMGINDGQSPEEPVNEDNIQGIDFFNPLDRYELEPLRIQTDPEEKRFGQPEIYRLQTSFGSKAGGNVLVHWTRILRFDGVILPRDMYITNNYWHAPVLQKTANAIRNFQTSHDSIASLMHDFSQAVFKINGLSDIIAQGNDDLLQKRLAMIDTMRSVVKAVVIEEGEEFERKITSLSGVKDVLMMINQRLVMATDGIPHTILLGESPSGLGATGQSEIRDYYDSISRKQETKYKPELERLIRYIFLAGDGPTRGDEPQDWKIKFKPLWQMDDKELVEIRKGQADTDEKYILNGVLSSNEVRSSRFGGTEYSLETKIESEELEPLSLPNQQSEVDEVVKDALLELNNKAIFSKHSHRDINGNMTSEGYPGNKPGTHYHWGHNGEMYSEEVDGPGHKHKSLSTGIETDLEVPLAERPDLVEDSFHEDDITKEGGKWVVRSKKGKKLGEFSSKEEAVKRLREIEAFKKGK